MANDLLRRVGARRGAAGAGIASLPAMLVLTGLLGLGLLLWLRPSSRAGLGGAAGSSPHYDSAYEVAAAANLTRWRNRLLSRVLPTMSTRVNGSVGFSHSDWALFRPSIGCPPDRPLRRYGPGTDDGTKLLCAMEGLAQPCVIYSMGSAGNYLFEEAMLNVTACEVHTFDCTVDGASIAPGRHTYHRWCIGSPALGRRFVSWADVTRRLGHDATGVRLLKIDIEGHEYAVLASLLAEQGQGEEGGAVLPDEISIEIHARYVAGWPTTHLEGSWQNGLALPHTPGDMALVFMHLANQGYGVYSAEENLDWFMCCSEFSLLRVPGAALTLGRQSSAARREARWRQRRRGGLRRRLLARHGQAAGAAPQAVARAA